MKKLTGTLIFQLLMACFVLSNYSASAQKTTIWLVRHAEKNNTPADDPELNSTGQHRAADLLKTLKHEHISAIFVTQYKRTALTAQPLADKLGIPLQQYNPGDKVALVNKITNEYKGKNVLIVGHSNTIVPVISALGCTRPFEALGDDDYDMLFKITIDKKGKSDLEVSYYGQLHHVTQLPERFKQQPSFLKPIMNY